MECIMGVNLAWLAIKGASELDVNQYISIEATDDIEQVPKSKITRIAPNRDWQVYVFTDYNNPLLSENDLKVLSYYGEVISALVLEDSLLSEVSKFKENKLCWKIKATEQSLECIGKQEEREKLIGGVESGGFDAPLCIANNIVGYRHDYHYQEPYIVMEEVPFSHTISQLTPPKRVFQSYSSNHKPKKN